jgi:hypothetical protein
VARLGEIPNGRSVWRSKISCEALQYNPNYLDAQYALEFVGATRRDPEPSRSRIVVANRGHRSCQKGSESC